MITSGRRAGDTEEESLKVNEDSDGESSLKSTTKVSLVGESASMSEVKESVKESDQTGLIYMIYINTMRVLCVCIIVRRVVQVENLWDRPVVLNNLHQHPRDLLVLNHLVRLLVTFLLS